MDASWMVTSWSSIMMVIISALGIYTALILFTRIAGLRSFSKMSSFDFAITVAIGSLVATTVLTKDPPLLQAVVALAVLFLLQMGIAGLRNFKVIQKLVDNKPLLLMRGTEMLEENMKRAKVSHSDMLAKLREANVTQFRQVKAVVMETTGDISVLHHSDTEHHLDEKLLDDLQ